MSYHSYAAPAPAYGGYSYAGRPAVRVAAPAVQADQYAVLVMEVPADARIYSGDKLVSESGLVRKFRVPARYAGQRCDFAVRVEVTRNGEVSSVTPSGSILPGQTATVRIREVDSDHLIAVTSR